MFLGRRVSLFYLTDCL